MSNDTEQKQIYIIISQTGTIFSKILKIITRSEYNHASISFSPELDIMYSFGRKNAYNPFLGGYVKESQNFGTFKRFSKTKVMVLAIDISPKKFCAMRTFAEQMYEYKKSYKYNYLGVYLAVFKICINFKNRYYCSEFVRELLVKFHIKGANKLVGIVHPMQFVELPYAHMIYKGRLSDFCLEGN